MRREHLFKRGANSRIYGGDTSIQFQTWELKQGAALQKNETNNHISLPTGPYQLAIKPFGATTD